MFCLYLVLKILMLILIMLFSLPKAENYMSLSSLHSQKKIKKYQSFLAENLKGVYIGMNKKQNVRIKNATNECRYFLKSNFVGVNRLSVLAYSNEVSNSKRYKAQRYYLPKGIIKNHNIIINEKRTSLTKPSILT